MEHANECSICYENFTKLSDLETGLFVHKEELEVEGCGHSFCRECLTEHCKHSIAEREIPICCPANRSENCSNVLPEHQVKKLIYSNHNEHNEEKNESNTDTIITYGSIVHTCTEGDRKPPELKPGLSYWTQFQRLLQKQQDPTLIPCTRCEELLSPNQPPFFQSHANDMICPHCGHKFCAVHGDSHLEQSCATYAPARQELRSEKAIRRFTKPCSHCGIRIHKESGCDHIVCVSCKKDMCFRCGSHEFLSGEMVRSCSKCQQHYIDHRYIWRYRITVCLSLPIYIPICILHVAIMTVLTIATFGCFCCLACGIKGDVEENEEPGTKSREIITFRPVAGCMTVLGMILLPVIDLFSQCGLSCCCLEIPGVHTTETMPDSMEDDDDELSKDDGSLVEK